MPTDRRSAVERGEGGWAVTHDECVCGHHRDKHTLYGPRDVCAGEGCDCRRYVRWMGGGD